MKQTQAAYRFVMRPASYTQVIMMRSKLLATMLLVAAVALCLLAAPSDSVDATEYSAGDKVVVPIHVSSNPGFNIAEFYVEFDNSALIYKGATTDGTSYKLEIYYQNDSQIADYQKSGKIKIGVSEGSNDPVDLQGDGVLLSLIFEVSADPISGERVFNVSPGDNGFIEDASEKNVSPTFTINSVHIAGKTPVPTSKLEIGVDFDYTALTEESKNKVTEIVFLEGVTGIPEGKFKGYTALKTVTIPKSVTTVGNNAFEGCTSLEKVVIGYDEIEPEVYNAADWSGPSRTIGDYAFSGCTSLKEITTYPSIRMGTGALSGSGIESITLYQVSFKDVPIRASYVFPDGLFKDCKRLSDVNIIYSTAIGTVTISKEMFAGCESLRSFDFSGRAVDNLGLRWAAFSGSGLESIEIKVNTWNGAIANFENNVFMDCKNLRSVKIFSEFENSFVNLSPGFFKGCTALESLDVGVDYKNGLELSAFEGCSSLKEIKLSGQYAISNISTNGISIETIDIGTWLVGSMTDPSKLDTWVQQLLQIPSVKHIKQTGENGYYQVKDGAVYALDYGGGKGGTKLVRLVLGTGDATELVIPDTVTRISNDALSKCTSLERISFPSGITKMYAQNGIAFYDVFGAEMVVNADNLKGKTFVSKADDRTKFYQAIDVTIIIGNSKDVRIVTSFDPLVLDNPSVPAGMSFGWFTDPEFKNAFDPTKPLESDTTIYAKIGIIEESKLINSVTIEQFVNGGQSVILSVESGADAPDKTLVVTYSAYVELPEGMVLNPFLKGIVEMTKDEDRAIFSPEDVPRMESVTVTCCYEIDSVLYSTPYAKAEAPTVHSTVDLTIDSGLTLSFNGTPVVAGDSMRYGYYTVDVKGNGNAQYKVNGIIADGNNRLFYYGQPLTVVRAGA